MFSRQSVSSPPTMFLSSLSSLSGHGVMWKFRSMCEYLSSLYYTDTYPKAVVSVRLTRTMSRRSFVESKGGKCCRLAIMVIDTWLRLRVLAKAAGRHENHSKLPYFCLRVFATRAHRTQGYVFLFFPAAGKGLGFDLWADAEGDVCRRSMCVSAAGRARHGGFASRVAVRMALLNYRTTVVTANSYRPSIGNRISRVIWFDPATTT
ncbi:hypothetical protein BaRGS_00020235 [Batillaria attramentaria]|uniref:Uncharacterized protein n=1 Tax=Batillaria attramentaria TaxID=370345 RepID=A0ABD0KN54_9CAEN